MKTITLMIAGIAVASSATATDPPYTSNIPKPFEASIGGTWFTGDLRAGGFTNAAFMVGLDYMLNQWSPNTLGFVGVRGWFGEQSGARVNTYGVHYGLRMAMQNASQGLGGGEFYAKIAAGAYNTAPNPGSDQWGLGGFAGIGYDFNTASTANLGVEAGFQLGPTNSGVNNTSWYAALTFRF